MSSEVITTLRGTSDQGEMDKELVANRMHQVGTGCKQNPLFVLNLELSNWACTPDEHKCVVSIDVGLHPTLEPDRQVAIQPAAGSEQPANTIQSVKKVKY